MNNRNNHRILDLAMRMLTRIVFASSLLAAMMGCSRAKPIGLAIMGYNYTNRFIASFTVTSEDGAGAWGGNVYLSSPTSGGGGGTCCVMLNPNTRHAVNMRIDWTLDEVDDASGHAIAPEIRKRAWVTIKPPFPADPHNFEVHFYPDGHVEAAVTHWLSAPRISLPEDRRPAP